MTRQQPDTSPAALAARAAAELASPDYAAAQAIALVSIAGSLAAMVSKPEPQGPPDADPITFADTCCGKCQFGNLLRRPDDRSVTR